MTQEIKEVTRLVIRQDHESGQGGKFLSMFFNTTKADGTPAKSPYFGTTGELRGFISRNGEGKPTGAVRLVVPGQDDEPGLEVGVLYKKEGANGPFFAGYTAPLVEVGKSADGKHIEYGFDSELLRDESGKLLNAVDVTASLDGPTAAQLFELLPTVKRPSRGPQP